MTFTYGPTGLRQTMVDGLGTTTWSYDGLGRVVGVTDSNNQMVGYGYDGRGNRTRLTYPDQKVVNSTYDALDRLITVTDWQDRLTTYTYDDDEPGRPRVSRVVNGITRVQRFDPLGRLTNLTHTAAGTNLASYQYIYDPSGNRIQAVEDMGRRNSPDPFMAEQRDYQAIRLVWPDSNIEEVGYQLDRSTDGQHWQRLAELPANTLDYVDEGLARHTRYDYRLTAYNVQTSAEQTLTTTTGYDPVDTSTGEASQGATHTVIDYTYDDLSRLMAADYSTGPFFHYEYDANGNRTKETTQAGAVVSLYDAANRMTSVGGVPYTWDNNGNLTNDGQHLYQYDTANRLVKVTQGTNLTTFAYNGLNDRLKENNTQLGLDLNAGLTQVLQAGTDTYLYGNERIAQFTGVDSAYFLGDALGSVRQLADGTSTVTLAESYEPYGEELSSAGSGSSSYGFAGEAVDGTGLIYLRRARYMMPSDGRFLTADRWQGDDYMPMSYNSWLYTYANPINYLDASGHKACEDSVNGCIDPPPTSGYYEKKPPKNITWVSNSYSEMVNSRLAPLFDRNDKLVVRTNAAQFMIKNHNIICEIDESGKCIKGTTRNQNFCGQVVLSAILSLYDPQVTAEWVVSKLPGDVGGTGNSDIYNFVNNQFGEELFGSETTTPIDADLPGKLRSWLYARKLIMPFVNIVNGSQYDENGGKVGVNTDDPIAHWVLITGVSKEWDLNNSVSPWNWVRIFNPFDNDREYYWWDDFRSAWHQSSSNYSNVLLSPVPRKGNMR